MWSDPLNEAWSHAEFKTIKWKGEKKKTKSENYNQPTGDHETLPLYYPSGYVLLPLRVMRRVYLVEAPVENPLHLLVVERGSLDLSSGVLVVERDCFAGSWREKSLWWIPDSVLRCGGTQSKAGAMENTWL